MHKIWTEYPSLAEDLRLVTEKIKETVKDSNKFFENSLFPLVDGNGKMLRPAMVLLSSGFGLVQKDKIINLAAAVETLHLATLIHDDIIDEAKMRRNNQTIQSKYGKDYAVYAGDYLLSKALFMISEYDYKRENMQNLSRAVGKICSGEILQYNNRFSSEMTIKNYLKIISGKTATLFAISMYVGSKEADVPEKTCRDLARAGYNIGMAFQIKDDLLDYKGSTEVVGKNTKEDILKGYYTLPMILGLRNDNEDLLKVSVDKLSNGEINVEDVIKMVEATGGIDRTEKVAKRYAAKGLKNLRKVPQCESKDILLNIADKLLERTS